MRFRSVADGHFGNFKGLASCWSLDLHKGDCGRVGIFAGSPGFLGVARLCSAAAVHAGAGLVTVLAKPETAQSLAISCFPEVMVRSVGSYREVHDMRFDSLAIGPGLVLNTLASYSPSCERRCNQSSWMRTP